MIVIWENGEKYSDYEIHFIDIGGHDLAAVLGAFAEPPQVYPDSKVVAAVTAMSWFHGAPTTLESFVAVKSFEMPECDWLRRLRAVVTALQYPQPTLPDTPDAVAPPHPQRDR